MTKKPREAPDANLRALLVDYNETLGEANEVQDRHETANLAARREHPKPDPSIMGFLSGELLTAEDIRARKGCYLVPKGEALDRLIEKQLELRAEYDAGCAEVDARFNVPALDLQRKAAWERLEAVEEKIRQTPAESIVGLAIKLRIRKKLGEFDLSDGDPYLDAICEDTERLVHGANLPELSPL